MHKHIEPMVGHWYDSRRFPESFTVIDVDKDEYIEIQYLDGELDQIDSDSWDAIYPEEIAEPEDPTAPYGMEHDEDVVNLLQEIEDQGDLDVRLHDLDHDDDNWM